MDLTDLHIFRSVVQAGGITRAAQKLNRVQSNVTTRVRQLETDLGIELFVRDGKKLRLSPAGTLLLDYAERLLDLAEEAREAVHDAKPRGLLRLGSMESTASVRLPGPMNEYLSRYPEVTVELRIGTPRDLAPAVREGELDAALVAEPIPDAPFEKIPVYDEELVIIAAANHPPIKSPRDVNGRPVLAFVTGCSYRQRMEDWFTSSGEMSDRIIETSSYHAILGCAVAGMGISMVPRMVLKTKFFSIKRTSKLSRAGLGRVGAKLTPWSTATCANRTEARRPRSGVRWSDYTRRPQDACAARCRPP